MTDLTRKQDFFFFVGVLLTLVLFSLFDNMQAIGVKVQNGYGLTETSPAVAARRLGYNVSNISTAPSYQTYCHFCNFILVTLLTMNG